MFAERLKLLREEKGYSQSETAELLDLGSQAQIWRWESGRQKPSIDAITKIATFFDVSVDYLLGLSSHRSQICEDSLTILERDLINALRVKNIKMAVEIISIISKSQS